MSQVRRQRWWWRPAVVAVAHLLDDGLEVQAGVEQDKLGRPTLGPQPLQDHAAVHT